jgi:hypothetical protein
MAMTEQINRQSDYITPPRWSEIGVYATSSTAATANLQLLGNQTPDLSSVSKEQIGAGGRFVRVYAMTADLCIVFADTSAHADDITYLTAGVNQVTGAIPIPAGTYQDFRLGSDFLWIGFITQSSSGSMVVYISSPS